MPTVKIPIVTGEYTNVDKTVLSDDAFELYDSYVDEKGANNRRPALQERLTNALDLYGGCKALYYWAAQNKLYGLWRDSLVIMSYSGGALSVSSVVTAVDTTGTFTITTPKSYVVDDGTYLYFSTGTKIVRYDPSAGTMTFLDTVDAQAPTTASHIAGIDGYLIGNATNSNRFYFSEVADFNTWSALDFASASGNADYILAVHVFRREVYLFGQETTEIWENDGVSPFIRIPGGYIETGISAPHSVVQNDDGIFWLSSRKRIVKYNGSQLEVISTPYDSLIGRMAIVSDATSDRIVISGKEFLVFHFPAANVTLAWNVTNDTWAKWGWYDSEAGAYDRFKGQRYLEIGAFDGLRLIGGIDEFLIWNLSDTAYRDRTNPIRALRTTGHINYGTTQEKQSQEIRLTLRRGDAAVTTTTSPKLMIRWRDNNRYWSQEKQIDLGLTGETDIVARLTRTGIYRTRQYQISCTENVPYVLVDAEEDIEVLR